MSDSNFEFYSTDEFLDLYNKAIVSDLESLEELFLKQHQLATQPLEISEPNAPGGGFGGQIVSEHEELIRNIKDIPDYTQLEYSKDFPDGFRPKSLVALVDTSGNYVNPRDPVHIKKLLSEVFSNEEFGEKVRDGFLNKIYELDVSDVTEVSARLLNVLDDMLKRRGFDPSLMNDMKRTKITWDDVVKQVNAGQAVTAIKIAECDGLYERMRSMFISSMNYRITQMSIQKNARNDTSLSYDTFVKMAYACSKFAIDNARATIRIEQAIDYSKNKISESFENLSLLLIKRAIDANQKTISLYGKTIRLKPGADITKQIERIKTGYTGWVNKHLDSLESRGLSTVIAAAIARGDRRDIVTHSDIETAKTFIRDARKTPGKFDSINNVLNRLSKDDQFAKNAGRFLASGTRRNSLMSELSKLGSKLSMHNDKRSRLRASDRAVGQALAANTILRSAGNVPGIQTINKSLTAMGLSVKRSIDAGRRIRDVNAGLLTSLRRIDDINARRLADIQMRARQQLVDKAIKPQMLKVATEDKIALLKEIQRRAREYEKAKIKHKKDDDRGPKR